MSWNSGIKELCLNVFPENTDKKKINSVLEKVFAYIQKVELEFIPSPYTVFEEYEIKEKICKELSNQSKDTKERFSILYEKLKDLEIPDKKRCSILKFLIHARSDTVKKRHAHYSPLSVTSTLSDSSSVRCTPVGGGDFFAINGGDSCSFVKSYDSPFTIDPIASSSKNSTTTRSSLHFDHSFSNGGSNSSRNKQIRTLPYESLTRNRPTQLLAANVYSSENQSLQKSSYAAETDVLKELLYCLHGVEGSRIIKYDADRVGFRLNPTVVNIKSRYLLVHLMELGYLHNVIKQSSHKLLKNKGVVAHSFVYAVGNHIVRYYQDLAIVDVRLQQTLSASSDTPLVEEAENSLKIPTLIQMMYWSVKHMTAFKCLVNIFKLLEDKHGGQLVSTVYRYVYNGNPTLHTLLMKLLAAATGPLYRMISHWIIKGEFSDCYNEFFIEHVPQLDSNDMWDRQFVLRKDFIPVFMKLEDAERVLQAGRCINFLHKVCNERPPLTPAQKKLKESADDGTGNLLELLEPDNKLSALIHQAFIESSRLVLHSLKVNFNFTYHFEALRKYMLLGQGDFIYCLMQALENDLNKTAGNVDLCRLIGLLESTLNSTDASSCDKDILSRLSIKMLEACQTESGWDAFCLSYNVDGPLNAIFKLNSGDYSRIFTFLWRIKRAEYFLCRMWRDTILLLKRAVDIIPEIRPIFNIVSRLVNQMLQFVNHFQYYVAFEVVEVSWCKFQNEVYKMESLDKIVDAHSKFMSTMKQGCMLTDLDMLKNIRNLLDYVLELLPTVEILHNNCEKEFARVNDYDEYVQKYGTDCQKEATNLERANEFRSSLKNSKSRLVVVSKQYQESLCTFLVQLSNHKNPALQILGHRIDFNEHYKNKNKSLSESFKFHKQSEYLNFSGSLIE